MPACAATWPANGIRTSCAPSPATPSPCCDPDGPSGPVFTWRAVDLPATLNPPIAGDHDDHSFPPIPDPARMAGLRPIPLAEPLATPAARRPARRAGWVNARERCIAAQPGPVILIAHSLGCITVAHWAAQATPALRARVQGALLVAPADVERDGCPAPLQNFAPIPRQPLGFASLVIGSTNDRAASAGRALTLADSWASQAIILEQAGHINTEAGYTRWEEGFAYLYQLQNLIEKQQRRWA